MTHASLCTGIGACELAATWMRWENLFSCEVDEFCNRVLKHHYPKAKHKNNMIQVIHGKVPSKSNSYKVITLNGHGSLAKQKMLKDYEKSFYLQCDKYRNKGMNGLFEIRLKVFYENQRPDLDNCLKVVLDCLQGCNAIDNDRNCVKVVAEKFIDKMNPRIEFELNWV